MSAITLDITLFASFKKGDATAENAVFRKLFKPLCLYSEQITSRLEASEDIVAEALEKGWDRRQEFQAFDNFKAFLYRLVRNASLNYAISEKSHRIAHTHIRYLKQYEQHDEELFENEILRAELLHEIYQEIEELPDKCGQIFRMIFIQGLSTEQIATALSLNVQTIRSQKARAIQLLRTRLLKRNHLAVILLAMILLDGK
ncbi:MAG: sigma-70 family RNA polymerase sigma factor [Chitinophagaceae bacterium]|nr:sigma-70 family RNA polymerase sigma factor [Chitinophagaceae bacterium]